MKIKFCGAATGVTGSCHLISTEKHKVLLDCGMFQGGADEDEMNRADFPFNPAEIEAVILSHAHIDHCGRLPLLYKRGFRGKIYATDATVDLVEIMLKDSAHINAQETETLNRKRMRAGKPLLEPLYTGNDVLLTINHLQPVVYDTLVQINEQMKIVFNDAGHILGSAIVELWVEEEGRSTKIVFSGDLGMRGRPMLRDPKYIKKADCLIMESTYGDRLHEPNPVSVDRLLEIIAKTSARGGNVVIPSFAVGRTQELIFELNKVYDGNTPYTKLLRKIPVYIDSPMAIEATEIFRRNAQVYGDEMKNFILEGDHPLDFKNLHYSMTSEESKQINFDTSPKVIISASGMCEAGRIRHHLKHNLWNPNNAIVFVGYQAEGSLGRSLLDGIKEVKLFGETIAVNAQIYNLGGFSGHADKDGLFDWLNHFQKKPNDIFLVHGEQEAKESFARFVEEQKDWVCTVVDCFCEYELTESTVLLGKTPEKEFTDEYNREDIEERMGAAQTALSDVLANAKIAFESGKLDEERLTQIQNQMAALEKSIINLGASVSR